MSSEYLAEGISTVLDCSVVQIELCWLSISLALRGRMRTATSMLSCRLALVAFIDLKVMYPWFCCCLPTARKEQLLMGVIDDL